MQVDYVTIYYVNGMILKSWADLFQLINTTTTSKISLDMVYGVGSMPIQEGVGRAIYRKI